MRIRNFENVDPNPSVENDDSTIRTLLLLYSKDRDIEDIEFHILKFDPRFEDLFCQCRLTHRQTRMVSEHCQCVGVMLLCFLCCGVVAVM